MMPVRGPILDLLNRRLQHLSETARRVLPLIAVLGRDFDYALLRQMAPVPELTILDALDECIATNFVEETINGYRFCHTLFREAIGRLYLAYRIRLHKSDEWQVVEQHAYCTVRDGRIERMDLLCSGFLPAHEPGAAHGRPDHMAGEGGAPMATDKHLPRPDSVLDAPGQGCATLTPLIRARIRDLESGRILEVRTDDPSALDSLQAWSRLTGNELVAVVDDGAEIRRFFIRRK
jgi:TusA-related sulfurtransferase